MINHSIQTDARCVLLDIEGTTSSISFVYDVMFPFVRENLVAYLDNNWSDDGLRQCLPLLANDLGHDSTESWFGEADDSHRRTTVADAVFHMMDSDIKATGLKQLQGLIWKDGFESGQMVSHLFDDVATAIRDWHAAGLQVRIYSSGSVGAQKLFFGHTIAGNLLPMISGHYDTTSGPKQESSSYQHIASDIGIPADATLFVSDVVEELVAARAAGMQTVLSLRPGNKAVPEHDFDSLESFAQIQMA